MRYSEELSKMIKESGLTLKEISDKCKSYGINIDPSYLSKLQGNKQSPASEDINIAIAKACNRKPRYLVVLAYLEKAPKEIRSLLSWTVEYLSNQSNSFLSAIYSQEVVKLLKKNDFTYNDKDIIELILDNHTLPPYAKIKDYIVNEEEQYIDGLAEGSSSANFDIIMPDNSMEPTIYKGSYLTFIQDYNKIDTGDIVLIKTSDDVLFVRRYIPTAADTTVFLSDNHDIKPVTLNNNDFEIIGKLSSSLKYF
jgi:SOS-response transcriptional repressor LexA